MELFVSLDVFRRIKTIAQTTTQNLPIIFIIYFMIYNIIEGLPRQKKNCYKRLLTQEQKRLDCLPFLNMYPDFCFNIQTTPSSQTFVNKWTLIHGYCRNGKIS